MDIPTINAEGLWRHVQTVLCAPPFLHSKKMGILHETDVPTILDHVTVTPRFRLGHYRQWGHTPPAHAPRAFPDLCARCWGRTVVHHEREGSRICADCGEVLEDRLHEALAVPISRLLATKPRVHSLCAYKRINHFKHWLKRLQGVPLHRLEPEVLEAIRTQLTICNNPPPTYARVRSILKTLGHQQYYNETYAIIRALTGRGLVELQAAHEERLVAFFSKIQQPFAEYAGTRVNFFNYLYIIRKLCQLLGYHQFAQSLPLLKSTVRIYQQDMIWKKICEAMGLPFYASF